MAAAGGGGGLGTGGKIRSRRYHVSSGRTPYSRSRSQSQQGNPVQPQNTLRDYFLKTAPMLTSLSIISRVTDTVKSFVPAWLQKYFNKEDEVAGVPQRTVENEDEEAQQNDIDNDQFVEERPSPDGRVLPDSGRIQSDPSPSQIMLNVPDVLTRPSLHRANLNFNILDSPALNSQPSTSTVFPIGSSGFSLVKEIKDSTSVHDDDNISTTSGFSSRASDKDVGVTKTGNIPLLWSPEADRSHNLSQNSSMNSKRPSFNPSAFASLLPSLDKSRLGDSPFYPGKTTYGGAAAYSSKARGTPYQVPVKIQVKAKPAHNRSFGVTSLAARRILQSLEKMSSPLADAKRMPSASSPISPLTTERSFISTGESASKRKKVDSAYPPVQKLVTPQSISVSFGQMKKIRPSLGSSVRNNASNCRTPTADNNRMRKGKDVPDYTPQQEPQKSFSYPNFSTPASNGFASGRGGGKIVRERGERGDRRSTKKPEEEVESPCLPDVPLPISMKELPKFSLSSELKTTPPPASKPVSVKIVCPNSVDSSDFKFSQPLVKSTKSTNLPEQSSASPVGFTFSAPALKNTPQSNTTSTLGSPAKSPNLNSSGTKQSEEEDYGGFKPAKTLKEGSVLDILRTPGFMSTSSPQTKTPPLKNAVASPKPSFGETSTQALGIWYCNTCLLENKASDTKCVACGSAKDRVAEVPKQSSTLTSKFKSTPPLLKSVQGFGDVFKVAPGTWDCDTCLVQNKPEASKCVACETPKPTTQAKATLLVLPTTKSDKTAATSNNGLSLSPSLKFEELARKPIGSWDCSVCLVQNKAEDNKCVACMSAKTGVSAALATTTLPSSAPATQGSLSLLDQFKKPTGSWDCDVCLVQNKAEEVRCVACQSAKPGTKAEPQGFPKPSFSSEASFPSVKFGLSSSDAGEIKLGTSTESSTTNTAGFSFKFGQSSKTSDDKKEFSFGTATGTSNTAASPFNFGLASSASTEKDSTAKPLTSDFQFGIPTSKSETSSSSNLVDQPPKEKSATPLFGLKEPEEKKGEVPAVVGFSFGKVEQKDKPPTFVFGKKDEKTDTTSTGTSLFGSKSEGEQTKTFVFGKSEPAKAESTISSFAFGNPKPPEKDADQAAKPAFTFGVSAIDAGPTKSVFGFQSSGSSSAPQSSSNNVLGTQTSSAMFSSTVQSNTAAAAPIPSSTSFSGSASLTAPPGSSNVFGSALSSNAPAVSSNIFGSDSGTQSSTPAFGSAAPGNTSSSSSVFGGVASASPSNAPASSISLFGNSSVSEKPSSTPFVFGQPTTTASGPLFGGGIESKPAFGFSAQESKPATSTNTAPPAAAAAPFVFGGSASSSAAPSFNFGTQAPNSTGTSSTPFIFGSAPGAAASAPAAASPVPTFGKSATQTGAPAFGSSASNSLFSANAQTVPAFGSLISNAQAPSFGQQSNPPAFGSNPAPSTGVPGPAFQFGNTNANSSFNFAASGGTPTGVFTFGTNPGANPAQPQNSGFAFGAPSTFNMGTNGKSATPSNISNRKIKTARRRK